MTFETESAPAFQLQLPVFEGPLDLLLHLIEREEMDITAVSLVQVTDQYLSHLRSGQQIDATALAEFIAIGARLLYLKSRALLPQPAVDEEEEEELGDDLVQRLREYRRYKEAAGTLREIEEMGLRETVKVMVGGAPLSQEFADDMGADGYGDNAIECVDIAKRFMGVGEPESVPAETSD